MGEEAVWKPMIDMVGKSIGKLTVSHRLPIGHENTREVIWVCYCQCGKMLEIKGSKLRKRKMLGCTRCVKHPNYQGYKEIPKRYWTCLQKNAILRGFEFTVSMELGWEILASQNHRCALSGLPIGFAPKKADTNKTASLDRIDSYKGYVEGNIQWLHKDINKLKGKFSDSEVIRLAKLIAEYRQ